MWFLIKGSIFFAAVLVVLSYFSNRPVNQSEGAQTVQVGDAISAATGAYSYIAGLCAEKPDVCQKGAETLSVLGARAAEGAHVAFELLDSQFGDKKDKTASAATIQSRDVAQVPAMKHDPNPTPFPVAAGPVTQSIPASDPIYTGTVPLPLKRPHP
ncbi:DUF5330 domain-containing protein [Neorhizobium sp. NCHU2750]|uniref:DUF5330 domain-containing protein n=1 Tax=Neorhizobium sp. NCHU2750 TaxID=1825976 RepID=UPI000E74DF87|nr:hypothetical protein NCHU2750_07690 [Neorhizobium sp. NCHU2750]